MNNPKVTIGFIAYGESTAKYLPYFLPSVFRQSFKDFQVLCQDNSENDNNTNFDYIKDNFPELKFKWSGKNLGFSKAYNLMIKEALDSGSDYFLAVNPDMILEETMLENLVSEINNNEKNGAIQAKILKWDFEDNKKNRSYR